jgi:hypothetical protein
MSFRQQDKKHRAYAIELISVLASNNLNIEESTKVLEWVKILLNKYCYSSDGLNRLGTKSESA